MPIIPSKWIYSLYSHLFLFLIYNQLRTKWYFNRLLCWLFWPSWSPQYKWRVARFPQPPTWIWCWRTWRKWGASMSNTCWWGAWHGRRKKAGRHMMKTCLVDDRRTMHVVVVAVVAVAVVAFDCSWGFHPLSNTMSTAMRKKEEGVDESQPENSLKRF